MVLGELLVALDHFSFFGGGFLRFVLLCVDFHVFPLSLFSAVALVLLLLLIFVYLLCLALLTFYFVFLFSLLYVSVSLK